MGNDRRLETVDYWHQVGGRSISEFSVDPDRLDEVDINELRAAVEAGMSISIEGGSGTTSTTSLAFLAPIVPILRDLQVWTSNRITDLDVLSDAQNLRAFQFIVGRCADVLDLSQFPHLEVFEGEMTKSISSVLRNPSLRFLRVLGAIPKSFARVSGPVEVFDQEGGRSQSTLPEFHHPEAMTRLFRRGPAQFDLTQLTGMPNLADLEITSCPDVSGLAALAGLPKLADLQLKGVGTRESWDLIPPHPIRALLNELSPYPPTSLLETWRAAGWSVPLDPEPDDSEEIVVDDAGDGESWGVYMSRFDSLAAAVDVLDGTVAGGRHGERLILSAVAELRAEGAVLDAEPDSEGDFAVVYFPTQDQAEQVAALARTILQSDTATQLHHLRAVHGMS